MTGLLRGWDAERVRMNSRAWTGHFDEVPWDEIAAQFHATAAEHPVFRHMADVVDSVLACGGGQRLAGLTSMHDLVVTARPVPASSPIAVVVVHSPSSGHVGAGGVVVEHRSITGHDDRIFRTSDEAVPLFWRFMIEKFGVEPTRPALLGADG
ncbi:MULTISPECIES: hypothetical protein [Actinosynnema]|uniref:hypothetical protein n=1 Tax=Actinosynnema TaxID=40566 RepID=UPI0020A2DF0F|nr:hypothetical protein [Actinosynnema pretiosum]MCP2098799.1 hypothetical protein [Actinosynnema pretiosum]